ncbi:MAG TPA: NADPH-dependent FMN reductase [Clostridiales bacterium]|nr:NADPH-dependent FMN reductase [Clostridiales bacterium]
MEKIKILAIVGSFRKESLNLQLALATKEALGERAEFTVLDFEDVPMMNEDIEFPTPEAVARVREAVKAADGVWFFTPEYNHFLPGLLKNLIDWLSRPISQEERRQVLARKPAAISGITPGLSGTCSAQDTLASLLGIVNMDVMNSLRLTIANAGQEQDENGKLKLTISQPFLEKQADLFLKFIEKRKNL